MRVFTTGQVAKICHVAPRTVSNWFDTGRLKGYRIPNSQDRRIPKKYLVKFLKEHGMPLGDLKADEIANVTVVSQDTSILDVLERELDASEFNKAFASNGFDAGIYVMAYRPDVMTVDFSIGRAEALRICRSFTKVAAFGNAVLIALTLDRGAYVSPDLGIDETFIKPFDAHLLVERIKTLAGQRVEQH